MDDAVLHEVRQFWRRVHAGILSTTSAAVPGNPFGSAVPYVTTAEGTPVIYVSDLAQHTKNLRADPRAFLTVLEPDRADPQASSWISLLGGGVELTGEDRDAVSELYFARFPMSRHFANTHDFAFWAFEPKRIRFIGGFGKIHWIEPADWCVS